jgi:hypothetical protein
MARDSVHSVAGKAGGHRVFEVGANLRIVAHADDQHFLEALSGIGGTLHAGYDLSAFAIANG